MERTCVVCGASLEGLRADAKTDSDTCRQILSRFHRQIGKQADRAREDIHFVALAAADSYFSELAAKELEAIIEYAKAVHADVLMHQLPRPPWSKERAAK